MGGFWQDVKYAVRTLAKSPGFSLVVVLTLALGIGANTAIFSVVNGVLLRPLPCPNPGQLVSAYTVLPNQPKFFVSVADFKDFVDRQSVFSSAALYAQRDLDLTSDGVPMHLSGMGVSNGYFETLGYRPALGVFGVISYLVTQRTNEIGIRMALGALQWDVLAMIAAQGAKIAFAGIAIGLLAAAMLTRGIQSLLFNVSPFDPLALAAVAALLLVVTLVACYLLARRAAQVDPMVALRHE